MCPPRIMPKLSALSKIAGGRQHGHGLLAGVDEVGVLLALVGERADAEHAVLALQLHVDAGGNVVGHQRRDADAEVDVEAVLELARGAGGHFVAGPGHVAPMRIGRPRGSRTRLRVVRCSMRLFGVGHVHDAFDEDAGGDDVVGVDLAGLHQLLDLGHRHLGRGGHHRVEVARGVPVDEVALGVALPGVHDGEVGEQAALHE